MKLGIDVSANQGYIDWGKVKGAGVEYVILRSTRLQGQPDMYLASNIKGCHDNGIPIEFYKYSYAKTNFEAKQEALRVIEVLKGYGITPNPNTVIWADIEDKNQLKLGKKAVAEIIDNFKEIIVNSGYGYGFYTYKGAYETRIDGASIHDKLWLARYYAGDRIMQFGTIPNDRYKPAVAAGSKSVLNGWQFTEHGRVAGISKDVDMNIRYTECGSITLDLQYYTTPEFHLIDYLNRIGADSSYSGREAIAKAGGITNYSGTDAQNIDLLELVKTKGIVKD